MRGSWFGAGLLFTAGAVACSGQVVIDFDGDGSGGTGGTTTTSTTTTTNTGGTTTTSTTTTSTGGGPACGKSYGTFGMLLDNGFGDAWGCDAGFDTLTGEHEIQGVVLESSAQGIAIDTCPPMADCSEASLYKLSFSATNLYDPMIPVGAFVDVRVRVEMPWGCEHALQIRNLPTWYGQQNPTFWDERLFLLAADGALTTFDDTPFAVGAIALGCYPDEPPGCGPADDYLLRFVPAQGTPIDVPMGQSAVVLVGPGGTYFDVHNLRSFETGYCDDYWNWGFWAMQVELLGG